MVYVTAIGSSDIAGGTLTWTTFNYSFIGNHMNSISSISEINNSTSLYSSSFKSGSAGTCSNVINKFSPGSSTDTKGVNVQMTTSIQEQFPLPSLGNVTSSYFIAVQLTLCLDSSSSSSQRQQRILQQLQNNSGSIGVSVSTLVSLALVDRLTNAFTSSSIVTQFDTSLFQSLDTALQMMNPPETIPLGYNSIGLSIITYPLPLTVPKIIPSLTPSPSSSFVPISVGPSASRIAVNNNGNENNDGSSNVAGTVAAIVICIVVIGISIPIVYRRFQNQKEKEKQLIINKEWLEKQMSGETDLPPSKRKSRNKTKKENPPPEEQNGTVGANPEAGTESTVNDSNEKTDAGVTAPDILINVSNYPLDAIQEEGENDEDAEDNDEGKGTVKENIGDNHETSNPEANPSDTIIAFSSSDSVTDETIEPVQSIDQEENDTAVRTTGDTYIDEEDGDDEEIVINRAAIAQQVSKELEPFHNYIRKVGIRGLSNIHGIRTIGEEDENNDGDTMNAPNQIINNEAALIQAWALYRQAAQLKSMGSIASRDYLLDDDDDDDNENDGNRPNAEKENGEEEDDNEENEDVPVRPRRFLMDEKDGKLHDNFSQPDDNSDDDDEESDTDEDTEFSSTVTGTVDPRDDDASDSSSSDDEQSTLQSSPSSKKRTAEEEDDDDSSSDSSDDSDSSSSGEDDTEDEDEEDNSKGFTTVRGAKSLSSLKRKYKYSARYGGRIPSASRKIDLERIQEDDEENEDDDDEDDDEDNGAEYENNNERLATDMTNDIEIENDGYIHIEHHHKQNIDSIADDIEIDNDGFIHTEHHHSKTATKQTAQHSSSFFLSLSPRTGTTDSYSLSRTKPAVSRPSHDLGVEDLSNV